MTKQFKEQKPGSCVIQQLVFLYFHINFSVSHILNAFPYAC